jgi:hypothetical protein
MNENSGKAMYRRDTHGPCFTDVCIRDNAGSNTRSEALLGPIYQPPPGYTVGHHNTQSLLSGSVKDFTPSEVEVLYLN